MAEAKTITTNKPGWLDLSSADAAASREFYSKLFGWSAEVSDDPQYGGYAMFKLGGKEVGGVGPRQNDQQPTAWTVYVLVENADATAEKAQQAGGQVFAPPFDVGTQGRMAIIADPSGAVFGIWQAGEHSGWEIEGDTGAVCWVELTSRNLDAAKRFYTDVFGWTATKSEIASDMEYWTFSLSEGQSFAGGLQAPEQMPAEVPSYWQPYIAVDNADATAAKAKELGATVMVEPADIPNTGRFAVIGDPLGGVFGILQPLPRQPA
ncbi:MAG: VOC family protein [Candidatus Dormibacteraeota bacterium]|nr:VOC family protein [Candidatus Dormibacteraeota bacterium]MBV9525435.1 VOC family protein [Candidatus Dormibacteraeota bacterium]